ncbi:MAG: RNA polymerase sigma factor [Actinomycetota bacterium]|nr:RNA polymerase sigma factor [Actinomycetota bacterium]
MSMRRDPATSRLGEQFEQVLAAAQAGAPWALERLWLALSPVVAGYLRVQGAAEPDELTSDVFLAAFRGLRSFSGNEASFRSWIFTIAHHRLVDERRRHARLPRTEDDATAVAEHRPGGDVEQEALRALSADRVRQVCDRLSPDQRDVLLLRMVADLSLEETAATVGKPVGAVKSLQHRALESLRRQLADSGSFDRGNLPEGVSP